MHGHTHCTDWPIPVHNAPAVNWDAPVLKIFHVFQVVATGAYYPKLEFENHKNQHFSWLLRSEHVLKDKYFGISQDKLVWACLILSRTNLTIWDWYALAWFKAAFSWQRECCALFSFTYSLSISVQYDNSTTPLKIFKLRQTQHNSNIISYQTYPVIVFDLEVHNMPRDTCQWLRHLILTTQSIILPVKVKLGVIYIKIANVCSVC